MQRCNEIVEQWLRGDVASIFDAMQADSGRAISADEVFAALRTRHADVVDDIEHQT